MYELQSSDNLQQCLQYWTSRTTSGSGYLCCFKSLTKDSPGSEGNNSMVDGNQLSSGEQWDFTHVSFACSFSTTPVALHSKILATANFFPEHPCKAGNYAGNFMHESGHSYQEIPWKLSYAISFSEIWILEKQKNPKSMIHSLCMLMEE